MMTKLHKHPFAATAGLDQLDPLLQHRTRLGVLILVSGATILSFSRLKDLLNETDGNLGAQLRKLENAGYLTAKKEFKERKPVTWYAISPAGQNALKKHLAALEILIKSARR